MNLDLSLLRSFISAAELGSYTAAADELDLAQPTISLQMKRLEERLNISLFVPSGRGKKLTTAGQGFLKYARRLVIINDRAIKECQQSSLVGHLRIGTTQDFAEERLLLLLQTFNEMHPDVQLSLNVDLNRNIHKGFNNGLFDIAIAAQDPNNPIAGKPLYSEPLKWIIAQGYEPPELLPLVLFHEPCIVREHTLRTLSQHGRQWRLACESPSLIGLLSATRAGLGITVRTKNQLGSGLIELDGSYKMPLLPPLEITLFEKIQGSTDRALHRRMIELIERELFSASVTLNQS